MIDIEKAKKEFYKYVSSFDMNNDMIRSKYSHTYRVCEQSIKICESLGLDEENTKLAYLIALLHDIGRFEQAKKYKTFNDSKTVDHADYGCELLFRDNLIRKFIEDDSYDDIISESIYYHNKYSISPILTDEDIVLHAKIIRDADKIDIIHNVVDIGGIRLSEDDNGISKKVMEEFYQEKPVHHSYKNTKNDSVLVMIAFVFDLNFDYSYQYFKDHKFINKMYKKLENKKLFEPYANKANDYVERKCEDVKYKIRSQRSRKK